MPRSFTKEYAAIRCEGDAITLDFIDSLNNTPDTIVGQKPADFSIKDVSVSKYTESVFSDIRKLYLAETKDIPHKILGLLGFKPERAGTHGQIDVESKRFNIKFLDTDPSDYNSYPPLLMTTVDDFDRTSKDDGFPGRSPQSVINDYLNAADMTWGILINDEFVRIVRVSSKVTRYSYIEFDMKRIVDDHLINEFRIFFRLAHRSRFPSKETAPHECFLEKYNKLALEEGHRARNELSKNVESALETLGQEAVRNTQGSLDPLKLYNELLRLTYRIMFLLISEERKLLTDNRLYEDYFSISRIRDLAHSPVRSKDEERSHYDLYEGLKVLFKALQNVEDSKKLGLVPLNGELYDEQLTPILSDSRISNKSLLQAVYNLTTKKTGQVYGKINFARIDVEELGSIYESLLELHSSIINNKFELIAGGKERKQTGSYYTPSELVHELVESALAPVMNDGIGDAKDKESAILSISICDPACGSGHFLLAAARRLGRELAKVRTGDEEPSAGETRKALRDVITHCIYGVDKNPLAVELCKLALWVEGHCKDTPLTFLDDQIKCGDSLVGVFDLSVLKEGIPDDAYKAVEGDDKNLCSQLKKKNKAERNTILLAPIFENQIKQRLNVFSDKLKEIMSTDETTVKGVHEARDKYEKLKNSPEWLETKLQCDVWMNPFFAVYSSGNKEKIATSNVLTNKIPDKIAEYSTDLSRKFNFFHWQLEFPHIFAKGGFDVVLGNPPWERIKLQEQEFFATRDKTITEAPNKAVRNKLIKALPKQNPGIYQEFLDAKHYAESSSKFIRVSVRFGLTARGDINTYSIFAELDRNLLNPRCRAGFIVPTGIATDDTCKVFFADLVEKNSLVSLYDFENKEGIFPSVHRQYKFSLVTLQSPTQKKIETDFVFFATNVGHLKDERRHFTLTREDFELINPNTRTCPIFRTKYDAELTKKIYKRVPVLVNEKTGENPWNVKFMSMFHMANDSHLFKTRDELESSGYTLQGNRFVKGGDVYLPLYEAKMIWQYDHRFGTYEGINEHPDAGMELPHPSVKQLNDVSFHVLPWYWITKDIVDKKIDKFGSLWFLCFRRKSGSTNNRVFISSIIPYSGPNDSLPIFKKIKVFDALFLLANMNSIIFDYIVRTSVLSTNISFSAIKQLPYLLNNDSYLTELKTIILRVSIELLYTSWDLKPFADDLWKEADPELRKALLKQWEANCTATGGGHKDAKPPEWLEHDPENGFPKPPFMWDEERRARLKAELDAYYAKLYGLTDEELRYILDPKDVFGDDYPGETFRVLKDKEIRKYGEYRTKRLILEVWENLRSERIKHNAIAR